MSNILTIDALNVLNKLRLGDALKMYLLNREAPKCRFLQSILMNDLYSAVKYCPEDELEELSDYYEFLFFHAPAEAYGNNKNVCLWLGLSYDFWTINLLSVLVDRLNISSNDSLNLYRSNIFLVSQSKNKRRTPKATAQLIINANPKIIDSK